MNRKLLPHFLIIGAPKCGTTALHNYLSQHPDVSMSPKEIHFFGQDLGYKVERPSLPYYQSFFKAGKTNGDASVWYLYSDSIYNELKDLGIKPKIIVLLRNPIEVCYALHSQNIIDANEDIADFSKALDLEEKRIQGNSLPKNVDPPRTVYYKQTADFLPRIQKLLAEVNEQSVFIGLQETFKKAPLDFMRKIESFLELPHFSGYNFEKVNENKKVKNQSIHQLIKKPGSFKTKVFRTLVPSKKARVWLVGKIYNANVEKANRNKLEDGLSEDLKKYFEPNLKALNKIITPDIKHWWK